MMSRRVDRRIANVEMGNWLSGERNLIKDCVGKQAQNEWRGVGIKRDNGRIEGQR